MQKRLFQAFVMVTLILGLVLTPSLVSQAEVLQSGGLMTPTALDGGGSSGC